MIREEDDFKIMSPAIYCSMTEDNSSDIKPNPVTLSSRMCKVWADPDNKSFYLSSLFEVTNKEPRKVDNAPAATHRAFTPIFESKVFEGRVFHC